MCDMSHCGARALTLDTAEPARYKYGMHQFLWQDNEYLACIVCGALYAADDGEAVTARGEYAERCSGDTSRTHGYPGEHADGNDDHACDCLLCEYSHT